MLNVDRLEHYLLKTFRRQQERRLLASGNLIKAVGIQGKRARFAFRLVFLYFCFLFFFGVVVVILFITPASTSKRFPAFKTTTCKRSDNQQQGQLYAHIITYMRVVDNKKIAKNSREPVAGDAVRALSQRAGVAEPLRTRPYALVVFPLRVRIHYAYARSTNVKSRRKALGRGLTLGSSIRFIVSAHRPAVRRSRARREEVWF